MKLRRKALVHEAHIFDGTEKSVKEARLLLEHTRGESRLIFTTPTDGSPGILTVSSKSGNAAFGAKKGDYIVRDPINGELMPLTKEVVDANFDVLP